MERDLNEPREREGAARSLEVLTPYPLAMSARTATQKAAIATKAVRSFGRAKALAATNPATNHAVDAAKRPRVSRMSRQFSPSTTIAAAIAAKET